MTRIRIAGFGVSLDGFSAGTDQSLDHPLGKHGPELFQWFFPTRSFREMHGGGGGETGPDDDFARRSMAGFGAFILGRNMFGPIRDEWPDEEWKGWWGDNPPYHAPTFVLTHHARAPIEMEGADFLSRPAGSRAGALLARQSDVLDEGKALDAALTEQRHRIEHDPSIVSPSWKVYALKPDEVEFWQADEERRHTRLRYRRTNDEPGWIRERLWP